MKDSLQPSLFDQPPALFDQEPVATPSIDTMEIAAKIVAAVEASPPVTYDDRTSEAAKDQGKGPITLPIFDSGPKVNTHIFELPGKGRNNWYNQPVTPADRLRGMTADEISRQNESNQAGRAAGKLALQQARSDRKG